MAGISIRFDANEAKRQINELLDRKTKSIVRNQILYQKLLLLYHSYLEPIMPKDSGALRASPVRQFSGTGRNSKYIRKSGGTYGGHHGLEIDPYEIRPSGNKHYASYVLGRIYGPDIAQEMQNVLMQTGLWEDFCIDAAILIEEVMKDG